MDRRIILLSGPVASGKSMLARRLSGQFDMRLMRTSDWLRARVAESDQAGRATLQSLGDHLDRQTQGRWILDNLSIALSDTDTSASIVVDSVKIQGQIDAIRDTYGPIVTHIHMTAPLDVLTARYDGRQRFSNNSDSLSYDDVRSNSTERLVDGLGDIADIVIDSNRCTEEDVLVRVACHLRLQGKIVEAMLM